MARGKGVGFKGSKRRKIKQREQDSEKESDEEYNVSEDEDCDESDECYSLDGDESEEILTDLKKPRRVSRSRNTWRTSASRNRNKIMKPRKRRRTSYADDDDDDDEEEEEEVDDEDDAEFMSLGREAKRKRKARERKRVSYREEDDDEEDYAEFVPSGRKRNLRKKLQEKKRVSYTEEDDDAEFMSSGREANHIKKPRGKKRVFHTKEDDDDAEFMSSGREANQMNKPKGKKRVSYTGEDEEEEDYAQFVSSCRNRRKKPYEKMRVSDSEENDDDDAEFIQKSSEKKSISYTEGEDDEEEDYAETFSSGRKRNQKNKRVLYPEANDDDDDAELKSLSDEGNQRKKPREKRVSYTEEDDDEYYAEFVSSGREKNRVSYTEADDDDNDDDDDYGEFLSSGRMRNQRKKPKEKMRVSDTQEDDDNHDDDDDDDDDDEFMYSGGKVNQKKNLREKRKVLYTEDDDDSEFLSTSKNTNITNNLQEKTTLSSEEDNQEEEEEDEKDAEFILSESDFLDDLDETPKIQKKNVPARQKKTKKSKPKKPTKSNKTQIEKQTKKRRKQTLMADSDSDFMSPQSSDHEYTISEEEREQMREARVYCANLRAKQRSTNQEQDNTFIKPQRKYPVRKGKEKVEEQEKIKEEKGKQVCGICLSEEGKRTVRGVLNCCRHHFCFSCIMEWSKVESRCPLCKQRFTSITKAAKSDSGFDSRTVVIPVPECDQVYEPSEEELRGYLDPYESVICTECHHGGDDALMLLCDICDSPAHTFCVGLGREVPEGNWYCEGCRPTIFGTTLNPSSSSPIPGGFDLNELYVPETPLTQQQQQQQPQTRVLPETRPPEFMPATTLRDRRRIHRQIHHRFLNSGRRTSVSGSSSSSGIRLFGSELNQARVSTPQREDHADVASVDEHGGSMRLGFGQLHPCVNRSSIGSDASPSPYACREVVGPSRTSQGGFHAPF